MDNPQDQLADKLKAANYVLVTVSHNPSIDQLAALIGLTLALNKAGKHTAAVFSGEVPSTLEFLKPEDTIEKTTDSLRDFIIALDKSKADKLRYKVEDDVVRIFITPYRVSIDQSDLEFSQGDFNVDVVVALGVTNQEDLDEAIISHGRILHDATVATVNISREGDLGSIHWQDSHASSLSEMVTDLAQMLGADLLDNQIATALLTGIVAETERFSNEKTTAKVMKSSAILMAAGANQQLVASELTKKPETNEPEPDEPTEEPTDVQASDDTTPQVESSDNELAETDQAEEPTLEISHDETPSEEEYFHLPDVAAETVEETPEAVPTEIEQPIEEEPTEPAAPEIPPIERLSRGSKLITDPPSLGGQLTANSQVAPLEPSTDGLSGGAALQASDTLLKRDGPSHMTPLADTPMPTAEPTHEHEPPQPPAGPAHLVTGLTPPPPAWVPPQEHPLDMTPAPVGEESNSQTLADIESTVQEPPLGGLDAARDEVMKALNSDATQPLEPVQALNAQPVFDGLNTQPDHNLPTMAAPAPVEPLNELPSAIPSLPLPDAAALTPQPFDPASFGITSEPGAVLPGTPQATDPNAAPPVPPPIPFNFGTPPTPPQS